MCIYILYLCASIVQLAYVPHWLLGLFLTGEKMDSVGPLELAHSRWSPADIRCRMMQRTIRENDEKNQWSFLLPFFSQNHVFLVFLFP